MSIRLSRDGSGKRKAYRLSQIWLGRYDARRGLHCATRNYRFNFLLVLRNIFSFFSEILFSIDHVFYFLRGSGLFSNKYGMEMKNQAAALETY